MKLVTYTQAGRECVGLLSQDERRVLPVNGISGVPPCASMVSLIEGMTEQTEALLRSAESAEGPWIDASGLELCAPTPRPIHDIICVGVNYLDHRAETGHTIPGGDQTTVYFAKRASHIIGTGQALVGRFDLDTQLDYEVELAIIIGKRGHDIPKEEAESYIFGYSVFNDISSRSLQRAHLQWFRGKSLDGYAAMGPCILHRSALPFPVQADVISRVNGEVRQHSNTRLMMADIPSIIAQISQGITLEPGDIIATGTPSGVGLGFTPPRFLRDGDTVECEIPGIGTLKNHVVAYQG